MIHILLRSHPLSIHSRFSVLMNDDYWWQHTYLPQNKLVSTWKYRWQITWRILVISWRVITGPDTDFSASVCSGNQLNVSDHQWINELTNEWMNPSINNSNIILFFFLFNYTCFKLISKTYQKSTLIFHVPWDCSVLLTCRTISDQNLLNRE